MPDDMATDPFQSFTDSQTAPARRAVPVVPDDAVPLEVIPKALYVGTGGDIVMRGQDDDADVTWKNVPNGALVPFRAVLIKETGTTASDMLALY